MIECDIMKNNKGQALVEFIIVLPILLLIIMAIIDFGNIFSKKYSLENDLDVISDMYKEEDYTRINNYTKNKGLNINYEIENEFVTITLSKTIKVNTPILNNILGQDYKLTTSRVMYE
jgi:Flp pilus assembly protein TadG